MIQLIVTHNDGTTDVSMGSVEYIEDTISQFTDQQLYSIASYEFTNL